jgi:hypothetical protein
MRLAYVTADEVNLALATQMAGACGAVVCRVQPEEAPPDGLFDAVLYDLDAVPSNQQTGFLKRMSHDSPARPTAIHGYGIADEQAQTLRRRGITVSRRLHAGLLRGLRDAARLSSATVSRDDGPLELTWVNLVK